MQETTIEQLQTDSSNGWMIEFTPRGQIGVRHRKVYGTRKYLEIEWSYQMNVDLGERIKVFFLKFDEDKKKHRQLPSWKYWGEDTTPVTHH